MQREGHFVLSAADGQEGLERSRQYPGSIDLLITDVKMPRLNGTDLCAHLLEERPGIKVLVMSGAAMRKIVNKNVNLPFLPKPFEGQTLKARVREILAAPVATPGGNVAAVENTAPAPGRITGTGGAATTSRQYGRQRPRTLVSVAHQGPQRRAFQRVLQVARPSSLFEDC
jgi:DNA-binding response OmpR family regulator